MLGVTKWAHRDWEGPGPGAGPRLGGGARGEVRRFQRSGCRKNGWETWKLEGKYEVGGTRTRSRGWRVEPVPSEGKGV